MTVQCLRSTIGLLHEENQVRNQAKSQLIQKTRGSTISIFFLYEHVATGILETLGTNGINKQLLKIMPGALFLVSRVDHPLVLRPFDLRSALDLDLYTISPQTRILRKDSRLTIGPMVLSVNQYKS